MLTIEQKLASCNRHKPYYDGYVFADCLKHGITKPPRVEFGTDNAIYYNSKTNVIHIGLGAVEAESEAELVAIVFHLLCHELQHMYSSTDKDWEAAHKMCIRNACQKLSMQVFGKTRRLSKDADYDAFFRDLAGKGVFVNQKLLGYYAHFCINVLEDGRIENIRTVSHPGFGVYRKIFRGKRWLKDDIRKESFFSEDPDDLDKAGLLRLTLGQIYALATLGIYQKGFLETYGGSKAHDFVKKFIPNISRAVLGKTCKDCMDEARLVFDRLLDMILAVCTVEADAKALEEFLEQLLRQLLEEAINQKLSATPNTEEKGTGLPAESLFGETELEIEVDKETYEELKKKSEEEGLDENAAGVKIKVKRQDAEDGEGEEPKSGPDSPAQAEAEEQAEASSSNEDSADGAAENEADEGSDEYDASSSGSEGSSPSNESGKSVNNEDTDGESGAGDVDTKCSSESKGHNNRVSGSEGCATPKDFEEKVRAAMAEAMKAAKGDFELAEADAKLDDEFREAAKQFEAVEPDPIDLSDINDHYDSDVEFVEVTRSYTPEARLPLELESKGHSVKRKFEEIVKNKQEPDQRFLTSGSLDSRRLPALCMGNLDVFMKRGQPARRDVACFLLQDNSGSMGDEPGSTRFAACNAFAVLEEGIKELMPLKIAAFDAHGNNSVVHEVVKEFDEVITPNLSFNFREFGRSGWGNKDGYSIRVAARQLMARPEKDKILIVASDGFPTDYRGGMEEGCQDVKDAVEEARRNGIRVIGMYMYHHQRESDFATYREMYGSDIIFASLDEIEGSLEPILRRYF